ncbi:MAG: c-type cytochrome [Alphaproteobacteria bacterium]|uniref:C-type cytochrome n=1 Tax=Candidatus Nitrobium versatile TaxID=2884831 RepID=A0A953M297_9BACT|nr:c-type cytochrome [Candidatus Nitrobium versatile]
MPYAPKSKEGYNMKKIILVSVCTAFFLLSSLPALAASKATAQGKALFEKHCAVCHPGGGNTIRPEKTLHRKALAEHNITTAKDIIKTMRNPGPGMPRFDKATIPDKDAQKIAGYILNTFK